MTKIVRFNDEPICDEVTRLKELISIRKNVLSYSGKLITREKVLFRVGQKMRKQLMFINDMVAMHLSLCVKSETYQELVIAEEERFNGEIITSYGFNLAYARAEKAKEIAHEIQVVMSNHAKIVRMEQCKIWNSIYGSE